MTEKFIDPNKDLEFHEGIQCFMKKLEYDAYSREGTLVIPKMNSTDMTGCINLFKAIDPSVMTIYVYRDDKEDVAYALENGKWKAELAPRE